MGVKNFFLRGVYLVDLSVEGHSGAKGVDHWEGCWLALGGRAAPNVVRRPRI